MGDDKPPKKRRSPLSRYQKTPEVFWSMVDIRGPDECWPWMGSLLNGYGYLSWIRGSSRAHRVAYEIHHKTKLPRVRISKTSACVCHSCDNRRCCNPAHLWLGTVGDNNLDSVLKGRNARGNKHYIRLFPEMVKRGSNSAKAILKEKDIPAIKVMAKELHWPYSRIAKIYGVSPSTIGAIMNGRSWTHVS